MLGSAGPRPEPKAKAISGNSTATRWTGSCLQSSMNNTITGFFNGGGERTVEQGQFRFGSRGWGGCRRGALCSEYDHQNGDKDQLKVLHLLLLHRSENGLLGEPLSRTCLT